MHSTSVFNFLPPCPMPVIAQDLQPQREGGIDGDRDKGIMLCAELDVRVVEDVSESTNL